MDWAMNLLQLKYREKQSDWFGKRGLSWHISTVIIRDPSLEGRLELRPYAHHRTKSHVSVFLKRGGNMQLHVSVMFT